MGREGYSVDAVEASIVLHKIRSETGNQWRWRCREMACCLFLPPPPLLPVLPPPSGLHWPGFVGVGQQILKEDQRRASCRKSSLERI